MRSASFCVKMTVTDLQTMKEDLDHNQPRSLESDSSTLAEKTKELEVDFPIRG